MDEEPKSLYFDSIVVFKGARGNVGLFDRGPHGLGDPYDKSISKVEWEVAIPVKHREVIERDCCAKEYEEYNKCYQEHNPFTRFFTCSNDEYSLKECTNHWKNDESIRQRAIDEYLEERTLLRSTGMNKSERENYEETMKQRDKSLLMKRRETPLSEEEKSVPAYRLFINEIKRLYNKRAEEREEEKKRNH